MKLAQCNGRGWRGPCFAGVRGMQHHQRILSCEQQALPVEAVVLLLRQYHPDALHGLV